MSFTMQSVKDKFRTLAYAGLFGGVVAGFGGIIYSLYEELNATSGSSYAMVQRALTRVEKDQRLSTYFGGQGQLKVYGQSNRYGRRRPHVISRFLEDGSRCYDTSFWVESPLNNRKALVTLQMVEQAGEATGKSKTELIERFLSVDLIDRGGERIILVQPKPPKSTGGLFSGWNPFSKHKN